MSDVTSDDVTAIYREIDVILADMASPAAISAALAAEARTAIQQTDRHNDSELGRDVAFETFVDGVRSDAFASVRPDGEIVAVWSLIGDVIAGVLELLRANSPVLTGRYRDSHVMLADGVLVTDPEAASTAREVIFVNTLPYARRIETGWSSQAPDGVYEGVAAIAQGRFGNQAQIRFTYANAPGLQPFGRTRAARAQSTRNPAIKITVQR